MMYSTVIILSLFCGFGSGMFTKSAATVSKDVDELKYFYIPSPGQKIEIAFNNLNSLDASNLKAEIQTVVIVDGFLSDSTSPASTLLSHTYSSLGDTNVIILDWGRLSGAGSTFGNMLEAAGTYLTVLGNVAPVGERLAAFLDFLRINKQIPFSNVTIVGHSLGAHIAGATGVAVRDNYNSLISRIAGLDPAGPFFSLQIIKDKRLHKGQASFVDIYHTNRGQLGDIDHGTGDVNIYVNGGKNQPGCEQADYTGFIGYCSHSYSWKFFNAAFNNNIVACPCTGLFALLQCTCTTCQYSCNNGLAVGPYIDTSARGPFHVTYGLIE